jgi:hypothetical protein
MSLWSGTNTFWIEIQCCCDQGHVFWNEIQCRCDKRHVRLEITYNVVVIRDKYFVNGNTMLLWSGTRASWNHIQCRCDQGQVRFGLKYNVVVIRDMCFEMKYNAVVIRYTCVLKSHTISLWSGTSTFWIELQCRCDQGHVFWNDIQCRCDQGHVRLYIIYNAIVIRHKYVLDWNAMSLWSGTRAFSNKIRCSCDQEHVDL